MKKILALFLSFLLTCSMFITCFAFGVSAEAPTVTVDGKPDDSIWSDAFWNIVDKTNGQFQATYANGLPDFAYEWAAEIVDGYLNVFVKINQGPHIAVPEGGTLSNDNATNVRLWVDSDMSDTARTTLFDITYNGTGCEVTRADKVNGADYDKSKLSCALTSGSDYTYFEISVPLNTIAYDPAKQFGIYFSVSDLNLTDTGDKYDALNSTKYNGNAEAPWSTTKFYVPVTPYLVDGEPDDNIWRSVVWNKVDKTNGKFQATYANGLPDFAYEWAVAKVKGDLVVFVKINQSPNIALPEGKDLSNTYATNVRLWVDSDMSDTARTTFFDFTYNGTGCEVTRADKVNGADYDISKLSCALTSGSDYTYFEFSVPLNTVGYDPAKQFGIFLTVSDVNLKDSGNEYDALNCAMYSSGEEPWNTTKLFKSIFGYDVDLSMPEAVVSTGKTYTGTTATRASWTDTDPETKLTDGDVGSLDKLGGSGPFVGFQVVKNVSYTYSSGNWTAGTVTFDPDERDENGNFYKVIDLGKRVKSIYKYSVKFGQIVNYGILFPSKVEFYASADGKNFFKAGDGVKGTVEDNGAATLKEWVDYTFTSNSGITARYIKVVITPAAFTEDMTPAPANAGTDGEVKVVSKTIVTAVSEISVLVKSSEIPVYSDIPVKKNGMAVDHVTAQNTTYPEGYRGDDKEYTADLTDNVAATSGSYDNKWYAFYYGSAAGVNTVNGIGTINVDLGGIENIGGFRVHIWQPNSSGIGVPEITVKGSLDNFGWLTIGVLTNPTGTIGWSELILDYELPVRYIKFEVKQASDGQVFVFLNEIEVLSYLHEKTFSVDFANQYSVGYQTPEWTYNGGETLGGVGDAVYIYTPDKGKTLGQAANPGIAWWQVWTIDWDSNRNCYYITAFYPVNGGSPKGGIEIPEKGFVVASCGHGNLAFDPVLTTDAAIGAPVYVYGMDILNLGVKDTMDFVKTNKISVFAPIDGMTPYIPDFTPAPPAGALPINNFGDYVGSTMSIYTRVGDKTTLGEVAAITFGQSKDFNLFYLIAVDSKNKVTYINQIVDANKAPESIKKDVVIPEGGYLLLCSSAVNDTHTQAIIDAFLAIEVGDTITLYNVDLDELATGAAKTDLNKAGFTVTPLPAPPAGALPINNFGDYVGSTMSIYTRVGDKTTLGEVAAITFGQSKDFNLFYLIAVDSKNKVTYINKTVDENKSPESIKKDVVIPEGGYLLLCSSVKNDTHTQAIIDAFLAIEVGDIITLYNVDRQALATGATKTDLIKAGFTVREAAHYNVGVNNVSDPSKVKQNKEDLSVLTDGVTAVVDPLKGFSDVQVVLFQNLSSTTAGVYPSVELVLNLGEENTFNTIDLSFYIEHNSMIGLPKDNLISISYATDPDNFTALADYTFEGKTKAGDKGVFDVKLILGTSIKAQYVKIEFAYGDSPFTTGNPPKPVWEWIGFTEIGVSTTEIAPLPDGALVIDNYGGYSATTTLYTRNSGKTTIGEVCELIRGDVKDYNYAYLVAVDANGIVTEVNYTIGTQNGKKDSFVIPEGGYVLLCNLNTSSTHTQTVIDDFKKIEVGDVITLINVDLGVLSTAKSEITLENAGFTVKKVPIPPEDALPIDNFGDYVGSTMSIYTRVGDKTTLGEVAEITFGTSKDFNLFHLVAVDSTGKVTFVNMTVDDNKGPESIKKDVEIPEGGYLLLCSSVAKDTHTQAIIDAFKEIKVDDTITLYNVDLEALAAGQTKKALYRAGFKVTPSEPAPAPDPFELKDPNGSVRVEDGFLLGITDNMTADDIKALFTGEVTVQGVGTGMRVIAGDQYIVMIILGDLNGNGRIDQIDIYKLKKALVGNYTMTDLEFKAACIRGADEPNQNDYLKMKKHFIGTYNIFGSQQAQG